MKSFFIGLDGGGTSTKALVIDESGQELARAVGPSVADNPEEAVQHAAEAALRVAGLTAPAAGLWAGLAGAGREARRSAIEKKVKAMRLARHVRIGTDIEAAFFDAFEKRPGILVISGTGSIAWGRSEDGRQARAGGWGNLDGDEGSGQRIGMEAIHRVLRADDGRAKETRLTRALQSHLRLTRPAFLVDWMGEATKAQIAALAPVVAATLPDEGAAEIIHRAVVELSLLAHTLIERFGPWSRPVPLAMGGGLLGANGPLRAALHAALDKPGREILETVPDGARGAATLACATLATRRTTRLRPPSPASPSPPGPDAPEPH